MKHNPKLLVVGNLLGKNPGYVTTQGQILAERLEADGFEVVAVSAKVNKFARLLDVVRTIVKSSGRVDLMILEVYSGPAFLLADVASFVAKLLGIPSVLVLHGGQLPQFAAKHSRWVRRILGRARSLVAPSAFLAESLERFASPIRVIPNAIDLGAYRFRLREEMAPRMLWMRSFHPLYNPRLALDVLALVKGEFPDATLVMGGVDKGLESSVKNSAREMGLGDSVRFPGFLDEAAKAREFSDADIFLNTNRVDNMPVSVVEACAFGLPVVATDVGGLSKLVAHGENAILVNDDDPEEMAKAVIGLLKDPGAARRFSENGRKLAERSSWSSVRQQWESLFEDILLKTESPASEKGSGSLTERLSR
ncbi:MAG: glycosyltransferase family 4 protein [Acidobacteriota bacterium]|nr:MAG: glycosyltransferase family 4 protein [Acidobacteriota bacterium]